MQETNEQFRILLSAHAGGLEKLMKKLGSSVIDKARPFYVAKEEAESLQKKCLETAVQFQRANGKSPPSSPRITTAISPALHIIGNSREHISLWVIMSY